MNRFALVLFLTWTLAGGAAVDPTESISDLVPAPYTLEEHDVQTSDGYILSVFRVYLDTSRTQKLLIKQGGSSNARLNGLAADGSGTGKGRALVSRTTGSTISGTSTKARTSMTSTINRINAMASTMRGDSSITSTNTNRKVDIGAPHGVKITDLGKPAVLLQHGLLDSCAGFLLAGPGAALAFLLADAGFDVWLANSRGSTQARRHAWVNVNSQEYWAFSFDQMAKYDLPETLAHVRHYTRQQRVSFVSHSQGGTILLAALASQPQLADQLSTMALMAPVTVATHVTSVPLLAMSALGTDKLFTLLGVREFLPSVRVISWLEGHLCSVRPDLCISILAAICGYRRGAVNKDRLPLYLQYTPAGSSVQNMAHWAQVVRGGVNPGNPTLSRFDWGTSCINALGGRQPCNQDVYGTDVPPTYRMQNINPDARMFIFSGGEDRLADPLDMELLLESLPEGVLIGHQYDPDLEHLDYIWGLDAGTRIYSRIITLLKQQA